MAGGRDYRIEPPHFVLAAGSDVPQITVEEPDGRQHYLSALLVASFVNLWVIWQHLAMGGQQC
jgi:hypothetical protein